MKIIKNQMKDNENLRIFQIFQICSILGVFHGNLRQPGGVLGRHGGILDVSWGKYRKKVEGTGLFKGFLKAKMEAKIIKIRV